jgi:hypothetical protein
MPRSLPLAAACAVGLVLAGSSTAFAGADGPRGLGATGTLEVRTDAHRRLVAVFGIETREELARFDLRSLSQSDSANPKAQAGFPPLLGNLVIVVDRGSREVTVWSPQSRHYFRSSLDRLRAAASGGNAAETTESDTIPAPGAATPDTKPTPGAAASDMSPGPGATRPYAPSTAPSGASPAAPPGPASAAPGGPAIAPWLAVLKRLEPLTLTVSTAGSELVDGHATTALDITATQAEREPAVRKLPAQKPPARSASAQAPAQAGSRQKSPAQKPPAPLKVLVHLNLADEYDGFPLVVRVRVTDAQPGSAPMELRLHVTNVLAASPPRADFAPPEGYEPADTPAALVAPGPAPK